MTFSGPNNGVVLNKCVVWIFSSLFIGDYWLGMFEEKFQIFLDEITHVIEIFPWINRRVDMLIRATIGAQGFKKLSSAACNFSLKKLAK